MSAPPVADPASDPSRGRPQPPPNAGRDGGPDTSGPIDAAGRRDAALEWLVRLAEPVVAPATRAEFVAWCRTDRRHLAAFEEAHRIWRLAGQVPRGDALTQLRVPRLRRTVLAWAGAGALATGLGLLSAPRIARHLAADFVTGVGEIATYRFGGSSTLTLDTATAVAIKAPPAKHWIELLDGRVLVELGPSAERALRVDAEGIEAIAGGTFSVGLNGDLVEVAVAEGQADLVTPAEGAHVDQGWKVTIGPTGGVIGRRRVPPAAIGAWRSGPVSIGEEDHIHETARQRLEIVGALALDVPSGLRMRPHPEGAPFLLALESISTRPSSRKTVRPAQCLSA
jgi:transmembrane sensor